MVYPHNINPVSDYICVLFIFVYTFGFSIGFGPAAWVYGSEVWPFAILPCNVTDVYQDISYQLPSSWIKHSSFREFYRRNYIFADLASWHEEDWLKDIFHLHEHKYGFRRYHMSVISSLRPEPFSNHMKGIFTPKPVDVVLKTWTRSSI